MAKRRSDDDPASKLFESLDRKHPDYVEASEDWDLYRDVLGEAKIDKQKYLPKGVFENEPLYEFRCKLAQWIPESPLAVEKIVAALYREKPRRELKHPFLDEFVDDVDFKGTHLNTFVQQIAAQVLGYGSTRVFVNARNAVAPADRPPTRADEIEQRARPYLILYNPLSVVDWQMDAFGQLLFVRFKEIHWEPASPPDYHRKVTRFVRYDRATFAWWEFVEIGGKQAIRDMGMNVHGIGVVPLIIRSWRETKPMVGASYLRYAARADIRKFQTESDLAYDSFAHAHPTLKVKTADELSELGIGTNTFIKLDPAQNEDASYIDLPLSPFEALEKVIDSARRAIFRHAGIDPLGVLDAGSSAFQASGVSRAWSFGTSEARILTRLADVMEDIEREIFRLVLRYVEPEQAVEDEIEEVEVQYPDEFDLSATQTLLDESQQIAQTINSPTLLRVLHKRIAATKVGDTTAAVLRTINREIDENDLVGLPASPQEEAALDMQALFQATQAEGGGEEPAGEEPEEGGAEEGERGGRGAEVAAPKRRRRRKKKKSKAGEAA